MTSDKKNRGVNGNAALFVSSFHVFNSNHVIVKICSDCAMHLIVFIRRSRYHEIHSTRIREIHSTK